MSESMLYLAVVLFILSCVVSILNGPPRERDNTRALRVDTTAYGLSTGLAFSALIAVLGYLMTLSPPSKTIDKVKATISANAKS